LNARRKKWITTAIKLLVCAGALWYLSDKVTIRDRARLADAPLAPVILLEQTDGTLRIEDPETGEQRAVPASRLADVEQLRKLGKNLRPIEQGLGTLARTADWRWAGWGLLVIGPVTFIIAWRLRLLLATQDISISYRDALLLTFAGNFFNFAMPGTTGGDIYKAYHIARKTHKRTEGITIILIDRAIGLVSFLILGAVAIFLSWEKDMIGGYGQVVGWLMMVLFVGGLLFFSKRVRLLLGYERLIERLPFADKVRRIDETIFSFRFHPYQAGTSLLVTLVSHFGIVTAGYLVGRGLGIDPKIGATAAELYLAIWLAVVVGYLLAAVPISYQGFGLMEAVFIRVLVEGAWCTMNQMLALTLSIRLVQILWSLPGVIVPWLGFGRPPGEATEEVAATARAAQ